jgi:uncharacterized membrane protein
VNESTGRQVVLVSMVVVGAVVAYDLVRGELKQPAAGYAFRTVWSIAVLFLLLAILADTVPALAGPFAGLVALAVLIGRAGTVNQIVNVVPAPKGGSK